MDKFLLSSYSLLRHRTPMAANPKAEERMPVWKALSELFLDTELSDADYDRIARTLAVSPYSEEKLEEILRFEVTPALKWNRLSGAGEWTGFDEAWLREKLTPRIDRRPLVGFGVIRMLRGDWENIKRRVVALRLK